MQPYPFNRGSGIRSGGNPTLLIGGQAYATEASPLIGIRIQDFHQFFFNIFQCPNIAVGPTVFGAF